nr:hypothetical protein [Tanacetum cinerariifolium]
MALAGIFTLRKDLRERSIAVTTLSFVTKLLKGIVLFSHRETSILMPFIIAYMSNFECSGAFPVIIEML